MVWEQLLPHALLAHWTEGSSWFYHTHIYIMNCVIFQQCTSFLLFYMKKMELFNPVMASLTSLSNSMILLFVYPSCNLNLFLCLAGKNVEERWFHERQDILPVAMILRTGSLWCPNIMKALKLNCHFPVVYRAQVYQVGCILQKLTSSPHLCP